MDEKAAIKLLKKHSTDARSFRGVLKHSKAVARYAVWLAFRISKHHKVDVEFVKTAALLHDIGRFKFPPKGDSLLHGVRGSQILKKEGLSKRYQRVCETHLGVGITKSDIKRHKLKLPLKDYSPKSIEEKIICYADKRMEMAKLIPASKTANRFRRELGPEYFRRMMGLHKQIHKLYKLKMKAKKHQKH